MIWFHFSRRFCCCCCCVALSYVFFFVWFGGRENERIYICRTHNKEEIKRKRIEAQISKYLNLCINSAIKAKIDTMKLFHRRECTHANIHIWKLNRPIQFLIWFVLRVKYYWISNFHFCNIRPDDDFIAVSLHRSFSLLHWERYSRVCVFAFYVCECVCVCKYGCK